MLAVAFVALPAASAATVVDGVVRTLAADTADPTAEGQPARVTRTTSTAKSS